MNQTQMNAFEGMEIKITTEDLMYPPKRSTGQELKDGSKKIEMIGGMMNMTTHIINRKVEAHESISSLAKALKTERSTLSRKLKRYGIQIKK